MESNPFFLGQPSTDGRRSGHSPDAQLRGPTVPITRPPWSGTITSWHSPGACETQRPKANHLFLLGHVVSKNEELREVHVLGQHFTEVDQVLLNYHPDPAEVLDPALDSPLRSFPLGLGTSSG